MSNLTMSTYQIWSCHVTLAAKLQKVRKGHQTWRKLAQEQEGYRQKAKLGVEPSQCF